MYIWPKPYYMQCPYKDRFDSVTEKELHTMSGAAFIENVAKRGNISKAESKRIVDKRPARKGRNPQTGEAIRIKASKALKFRPSAALKRAAGA